MKNMDIAFKLHNSDTNDLREREYLFIKCYMIFDIKMSENFSRKVRIVAGGHMTKSPLLITYSSVVSRNSVRIALIAVALNDISMLACNI